MCQYFKILSISFVLIMVSFFFHRYLKEAWSRFHSIKISKTRIATRPILTSTMEKECWSEKSVRWREVRSFKVQAIQWGLSLWPRKNILVLKHSLIQVCHVTKFVFFIFVYNTFLDFYKLGRNNFNPVKNVCKQKSLK